MKKSKSGFTIVELLIVIVIVAILAAITITAYNGIQQRARNTQRQSDLSQIAKLLELYYVDNGAYPQGSGSTVINPAWSTTVDASWQNLMTLLQPYGTIPSTDPSNTPGVNPSSASGYGYAYFSSNSGSYCGSAKNEMYIIVYRMEGGSGSQVNMLQGDCTTSPLGPYAGASNRRVAK